MEFLAGSKENKAGLIRKELCEILPVERKKPLGQCSVCFCVSERIILIGKDRLKRRNYEWIVQKF